MNRLIILSLFLPLFTGCGYFIEKQTTAFSNNLSETLLSFEDTDTVAQAMPTLLVVTDSMARHEDASASSKLSAAQMYGAYSGAFVKDPQRQIILSEKAFHYATTGSCKQNKKWCGIEKSTQTGFDQLVQSLNSEDISTAYALSVAWLGYLQANSSNWSAIASLPKAQALMEFVAAHDKSYDNGGSLLYLGALASTIPPALGGKPEKSKAYFEEAITITEGKNLLVKVEYARRYARNTFNKKLHNNLLMEVITADPKHGTLTLMNSWAIKEAKLLLADENEYFD